MDLTGVSLAKSTLQRLCEEAGGAVAAQEAAEAQALMSLPKRESDEQEIVFRERVEPESGVMSVSADGVLIHLREEGWKEVKVASISAVEPVEAAGGEVRLTRHSYRAGLWEARSFGYQLWAESCRRGLEQAQQVVCVSDGAAWIWALMFICFARRIEVLDWWHAVERLWTLARGGLSSEAAAAGWVASQKSHLLHDQLRQVMRSLRQLYPRQSLLPEGVRQAVGYLFSNRRRMRYGTFRHAGYPIGSGTVESACKVVVQQRMKQAGMRWSRRGAQAMLALRCTLLSDRWDETWTTLLTHT